MIVEMADSVEPAAIPRKYAAFNNGVLAYSNGPHQWSRAELERWPRKHHITINPLNYVPDAWRSMGMDVERFDCVPGSVPPWYEARRDNLGPEAYVMPYCSRASVRDICDAMQAAGLDYNDLVWGIATLDNDGTWTPQRLALNLAGGDNGTIRPAYIRPDRIWGVQWLSAGTYDGWRVFLAPEWSTV